MNKSGIINILRMTRANNIRSHSVRWYADPPKNPLAEVYSASQQPKNGKPYANKPFRMRLQAGKVYAWCLCGFSHSQPICDGAHKNIFLKLEQRPIHFSVPKSGTYWLCNCKQTKNRPFCDGSHKSPEIQEKVFPVL